MANMQPAKSKSIFVTAILLSGFLWTTLAPAQALAEGSSAQAAIQESEVKIFEVAPLNRTAAVLMPNAQTPTPPEPLNSERKSEILQDLGETAANPEAKEPEAKSAPVLVHLKLSARQPFFRDQAFLTLVRASSVHPETAIKFNEDLPGSAAIKLKVETGRTYLLDFAVKSWGSGSYLLETESGKQKFEDESAGKQHILVALAATSSGWTTVRIKREGAGYHLYYVEITQVERDSL